MLPHKKPKKMLILGGMTKTTSGLIVPSTALAKRRILTPGEIAALAKKSKKKIVLK